MTSPIKTVLIKKAQSDDEIIACYAVMSQLRPHISAAEWLTRVRAQMQEGYLLAFLNAQGQVHSCAGYRVHTNLFAGKQMYVDDLISDESVRGTGYGQQLFAWLKQQAREQGCAQLHLDSGVQRFGAHKFYLMQGMRISSHHFQMEL